MNKLATIFVFLSTLFLFSACQAPPSGQSSGSPYDSDYAYGAGPGPGPAYAGDPGYGGGTPGLSAKASKIEQASRAALNDLYAKNEAARRLGQSAEAVLVFPGILKGGFLIGGAGGNGTLFFNDGSVGGFYNTAAASYGFQAGVQKYAYALFMMDRQAIRNLNVSGGWEFGTDPNIVIVDAGLASSISTTTLSRGVYAMFFNYAGLMAGVGLQGTKVTRIYP